MSAVTKCRHGTIIPDHHCQMCSDEHRWKREDEVARSYLTPGTRVGSPTAPVARDAGRKQVTSITVETRADPIEVSSSFSLDQRYIPGATRVIIKDQDGEHVPAVLHERIVEVLRSERESGKWKDGVQSALDTWNKHLVSIDHARELDEDAAYWREKAKEASSEVDDHEYPQEVLW